MRLDVCIRHFSPHDTGCDARLLSPPSPLYPASVPIDCASLAITPPPPPPPCPPPKQRSYICGIFPSTRGGGRDHPSVSIAQRGFPKPGRRSRQGGEASAFEVIHFFFFSNASFVIVLTKSYSITLYFREPHILVIATAGLLFFLRFYWLSRTTVLRPAGCLNPIHAREAVKLYSSFCGDFGCHFS